MTSVSVSPFEGIADTLVGLLTALGNIPLLGNVLQLLTVPLGTQIQNAFDPAPQAGVVSLLGVGFDGTVTGQAAFASDPSDDLTFSAPTVSTGGGTVGINAGTGAFTYKPTQAQQQAAEAA